MTDRTDPLAVRPRTDAERDAFAAATRYADANGLEPPPERAYLAALPIARSIVSRRLVRGLLRGDPHALSESTIRAVDDAAAAIRAALPRSEDADEPPLESRVPDACDRIAVLPMPDSETVVAAPIDGRYGYDRLRLAEPIRLATADGVRTLAHPTELVPPLRRAGAFCDDAQADRIERELAESTANLALARAVHRIHAAEFEPGEPVLGLASRVGGGADSIVDRIPAADAPAALERLVTDGHPLHPSAKIRCGMSATDGLTYAPECTDAIDVHFVAVRADRARETSIDDRSLTDRLYAAFDGLGEAVSRTVPSDADEYVAIPVHPWQFYHEILDRYDDRRRDETVVPIPGYTRPATPLLNLRTVVPFRGDETEDGETSEAPPHCKLAIGVQLTNVERTVSPQAVHNGPRATRLLDAIAAEEAFSTLGFLAEPAGTCYYPPGGPHVEGEAYHDVRHLSALLRSNPRNHRFAGDDRRVVPAAALVANSPPTGVPLVREAVDRYAAATETTALADGARSFVTAYVEAVVPDQLRLLSAYGIALESHLQNSYVVFEGGRPVATLVRDFGGIRVHEGRLADRGLSMGIYPNSDLEADGERDLYWKLYYALFQNHLTELFVALIESTPLEADDCWAIVRERCRSAFDAVRSDGSVPEARVDRDETALFADPATHKALTTMRLEGKRHEYATSPVSNPLAGRSGSR
ncbi:IucA/IucC family protein [Halosolutus gelatinilyticus]|uniref:IucA/IucC family protein n=1 Tax=Halosolutus gelatinilyticus TaxID=2931975 RepID=UPI001FF303AF|nr:IucA/IucC family protein [Halosolutus gelatinilyticus]